MNFINKIISEVENKYNKKDIIKKGENTKQVIDNNNKLEFAKSFIVNTEERIKKKKVETLICEGDGLGIEKNIWY